MRLSLRRLAFLFAALLLLPALAAAGEHRIGFGYHYWETLDDIEIDDLGAIEDSGSSPVFSYHYLPGGLLRFGFELEYFSKGYGGSTEKAYAPQVYLLFGRFLYAGVGVGITQSDGLPGGDDWSDPWYAARVGLDLLLLPRVHLDINANYRADAFEALDNAKSDAITLGASLRIALN
jgi:hypothetical protein